MFRLVAIFCMALLACNPAQRSALLSDAAADSIVSVFRRDLGYIDAGELVQVYHYLDSIKPQMDRYGHPGLLSSWHRVRGVAAMQGGDSINAAKFLEIAVALSKGSDSTSKYYGGALIHLGRFLIFCQKLDSALLVTQQGYQIVQNRRDTAQINVGALTLAHIYGQMQDASNRRKYLFEALATAQLPATRELALNNLAAFYSEMGHTDSSLYYYEKLLADTTSTWESFKGEKYENMGVILTELGRYGEALPYFKKAIALNKAKGAVSEHTYINVGEHYRYQHQYGPARLFYDTAITLARAHENVIVLSDLFAAKAAMARSEGQYAGALAHLDSMFYYHKRYDTVSQAAKAQEIETRFAVQQKDAAIAQLQRDHYLANVKRERLVWIIVAILVGAALLSTISLLLYRRWNWGKKLREHQLQQQLLRSQMEPHFIFNSLSALQGFIRKNEAETAISYLHKFARLAQVSLVNARESDVPLTDEVEALESYLALQQLQHNHFTYEVIVYEGYAADDIDIPPMLLQPFVENAVVHGMAQLDYPGHITVTITRQGKGLYCVVEDNGKGMRHRKTPALKPSLSTAITEERLAILSHQAGVKPNLVIVDKKQSMGRGVRVELTIPIRAITE